MSSTTKADDEGDHSGERAADGDDNGPECQLLASTTAQALEWSRAAAPHERLLVGVGRNPALGSESVTRHHPGMHRIGEHVGRGRRQSQTPANGGGATSQRLGQTDQPPSPVERAEPLGRDPSLGRDVEDSIESVSASEIDRGGEVIEMDELGRRLEVVRAYASTRPQRPGHPSGLFFGHRNGGTQDRNGAARVVAPPLGRKPLDLGFEDGEAQFGVGPDRSVLGQRHGVVGPGPVDQRTRQDDHGPNPGRAGRVEQPPGSLDIDLGRAGAVEIGAERRSQVHDDVDALEQRLELVVQSAPPRRHPVDA